MRRSVMPLMTKGLKDGTIAFNLLTRERIIES